MKRDGWDAVLTSLLERDGRAGRLAWWGTMAALLIGFIVWAVGAAWALAAAREEGVPTAGGLAVSLLALAAFAISMSAAIAVGVRRLHDRGKSGHWLWLYYAAPVILQALGENAFRAVRPLAALMLAASLALSVWAVLELGLMPGRKSVNAYGEPAGNEGF
ncbi:MAG: DUF805 domain-containing protein [Hyphomicrobiales bacterium]|nr:DUF805 domain-containing protein [Hyphomicrobiales bacterium]